MASLPLWLFSVYLSVLCGRGFKRLPQSTLSTQRKATEQLKLVIAESADRPGENGSISQKTA